MLTYTIHNNVKTQYFQTMFLLQSLKFDYLLTIYISLQFDIFNIFVFLTFVRRKEKKQAWAEQRKGKVRELREKCRGGKRSAQQKPCMVTKNEQCPLV
jgi:hypothetical protein